MYARQGGRRTRAIDELPSTVIRNDLRIVHGVVGGRPDQLIAIAHERCNDANLPRSGVFNWRFGGQPSPYIGAIGNI